MGTCVPRRILGGGGYLNNKQKSIESISLVTGGSCPHHNLNDKHPIDLSPFRSLRDISWVGLWSPEEVSALSCVLKNNSEHLRELRLNVVSFVEEYFYGSDDHGFGNFFASQVLKLSADQFEMMFPALESLSLCNIPLIGAEKKLAYAFNFSKLSSLTLHYCSGFEEFLTAIVDSGRRIRLSSLEVVSSLSAGGFDSWEFLSRFLGAFQGLKDLFLTLNGPVEPWEFCRAVAHHMPTLTRFVCHQRTTDFDTDSSQFDFEEEIDFLDLLFPPEDRAELDQSESRHAFAGLNLECIGLGCSPSVLV